MSIDEHPEGFSRDGLPPIPAEGKPTRDVVRPWVRALYAVHPTGCCLHVVLDDGNIGDGHVRFCIQWGIEVVKSSPAPGETDRNPGRKRRLQRI